MIYYSVCLFLAFLVLYFNFAAGEVSDVNDKEYTDILSGDDYDV